MSARHGGWMQTFTGRAFYPLDPRPEDIDPRDIAHALSMLCRYGGHVRRFYSVAEHSWLLSHAVSPENALWALLHDASEAYLVDLPRPIKHSPGLEAYRAAESRLMVAVAERFGLSLPEPLEVAECDTRILLDERAALLASPPQAWGPEIETLPPLGVQIRAFDPAFAEMVWLERLDDLTRAASKSRPVPSLGEVENLS